MGVGVNCCLKPFQKFLRFGSVTLRMVWLLEPFSKCVLFWFFTIQLSKKHTLHPEITILYQFHYQKALFKVPKICKHTVHPEITILYQFHEQKALFKVPKICKHTVHPEITILYQFHDQKALFKVLKICNIYFWTPPPLALSRKFIRFGSWTLPSLRLKFT